MQSAFVARAASSHRSTKWGACHLSAARWCILASRMSTSLRSVLNDLASEFANGVLAALRSASLEDLQAEAGGGRARGGGGQPDPLRRAKGRLARRTQEQIDATLAKVVAAVKATKGKGLRAEEIKTALGLDKREMPRVLKEGLAKKKLKAKGQKRATTYTAR